MEILCSAILYFFSFIFFFCWGLSWWNFRNFILPSRDKRWDRYRSYVGSLGETESGKFRKNEGSGGRLIHERLLLDEITARFYHNSWNWILVYCSLLSSTITTWRSFMACVWDMMLDTVTKDGKLFEFE